jgi:hypothetical protein
MVTGEWGRGPDAEIIQFLRRICNNTHAALRLATSGYYEEALSQVRSVAEGINLLQLFILDPPKLAQWRANPLSLQPGAVRGLIEGHTVSPLISQATYKALCQLATHISPNYLSLSHFPTGDVYVGATWSVAGITLVAGQTATVLGSALAIATRILGVTNKAKLTRIRNLVKRLFKDAPDIDAERYKSFMTDFSHAFRREMRKIRDPAYPPDWTHQLRFEVDKISVAQGVGVDKIFRP